jgi:hypothetical protein
MGITAAKSLRWSRFQTPSIESELCTDNADELSRPVPRAAGALGLLSIFRTTESPFRRKITCWPARAGISNSCVARFSGWEGPLVLFQRERTKQTLDPYYKCHEEHDADYQQQQETIELLNSFGLCIRGIHDYLLVPIIKFE